jgi:hypothetical protein
MRDFYKILIRSPEEKRILGRLWRIWESNIKKY